MFTAYFTAVQCIDFGLKHNLCGHDLPYDRRNSQILIQKFIEYFQEFDSELIMFMGYISFTIF